VLRLKTSEDFEENNKPDEVKVLFRFLWNISKGTNL